MASVGQWHTNDHICPLSNGTRGIWLQNGGDFMVRVRMTNTPDMDGSWFLVQPGTILLWWTGTWGNWCELRT